MSVPQEAAGGGHIEQAGLPVLDPVTVLRTEFGEALVHGAEAWAPGVASAPWKEWEPETFDRTPRTPVPGLVRVGTHGAAELPVLISTLGIASNHIIGDQRLIGWVRPASVKHLPVSQQRSAAAAEKRRAEDANQRRRDGLTHEHATAAAITHNLMVRTAAAMAPGSVDFTVYNAHPRQPAGAPTFPGLQPLAEAHLLQEMGGGHLADVLSRLAGEVVARAEQLDGQGLRQVIEASGTQPFRWRMVALLGRGETLTEGQQADLDTILRYGPTCGISLIVHGIGLVPRQQLRPLAHQGNRWVTPANGGLNFTVDSPVPAPLARAAAHVATTRAAPHGYPPVRGSENQLLPIQQYSATVAHFTQAIKDTAADMHTFQRQFPLFTPRGLHAVAKSAETYRHDAGRAAVHPGLASGGLHDAFRQNTDATTLERLQATALYRLIAHMPGVPGAAVAWLRRGADARQLVETYLPALGQIVAVTQQHGREQLPAVAEPYIAQFLHMNPPAWAFQLVADAAFARQANTPPYVRQLREALAGHLEQTYGMEKPLLAAPGEFANPGFAAALAECELLALYDFTGADDQLRDALAWHAQRRFDNVDPNQLPDNARLVYNTAMKWLEEAGRQYKWHERAQQAGGAILDGMVRRVNPRG